MKKLLWMKVSNDKYELPLVVEDSASKLAKKCGVDISTVMKGTTEKSYKKGKIQLWHKVEVDEDDR